MNEKQNPQHLEAEQADLPNGHGPIDKLSRFLARRIDTASTFRVKTQNASYLIDREQGRWMRISSSNPRPNDGNWVAGGFTLNEPGASAIAHFADGGSRITSRVIEVFEDEV